MRWRILLQDIVTGTFLAPGSLWVESCKQAKEFARTDLAMLEAGAHSQKILQVVWCFGDPQLTMSMTVKSADELLASRCSGCPRGRNI